MRFNIVPVSLLAFAISVVTPALAFAQEFSPAPADAFFDAPVRNSKAAPPPSNVLSQGASRTSRSDLQSELNPALRSNTERSRDAIQQAGRRVWMWSLVPLVASQALDSASSYGMRELNPALADRDGGFGVRSTVLKFAVTGALIGVEYLIVRKSERSSKLFAVLNWTVAGVTTGLAVHNYAIR
jgi:hypothetical protein